MRAAAGAELDDPVGRGDDIEVVLDDQHAVAGVAQAEERGHQALDIAEMQAGGRFVEEVERVRCLRAGEFDGELEPLRLAAGERVGGLAELQVAEAEFLEDGEDVRGVSGSAGKTRAPR